MKLHPSLVSSRVSYGPDASPVTQADTQSNEIICSYLGTIFPGIPIVSEEARGAEKEVREMFWLVDPLDGTKDFLAGHPDFTINIALVKESRPVLGVIFAPAINELYYAYEGGGAFLAAAREKACRIRVSSRSEPEQMVLVTSRYHGVGPESSFAAEAGFAGVFPRGSSLKGCMVARGDADVYLRLGNVHSWDICAMTAIVKQAGGKLTDLRGAELRFDEPELLIQGFIASNDSSHLRLLELARKCSRDEKASIKVGAALKDPDSG